MRRRNYHYGTAEIGRPCYPDMSKVKMCGFSGGAIRNVWIFSRCDQSVVGGPIDPHGADLGTAEANPHTPKAIFPKNPHVSAIVRIADLLNFRGVLVVISPIRTTIAPGPNPG